MFSTIMFLIDWIDASKDLTGLLYWKTNDVYHSVERGTTHIYQLYLEKSPNKNFSKGLYSTDLYIYILL